MFEGRGYPAIWLAVLATVAGCGARSNEVESGEASANKGGNPGSAGAVASSGSAAAVGGSTGASAATGGGPVTGLGGQPLGAAGAPEPPVTRPIRALQIASGRDHSCALLENHQVKCWGDNGYGELGQGDRVFRGLDPAEMGDELPFVQLGTGRSAKSIAAGRYSTCAILDDDSLKCWGLPLLNGPLATRQQYGLEPGQMGDDLPIIDLGPGRTAKAVGIGHLEACVARDDDTLLCSGTSNDAVDVPATTNAALVSLSGSTGAIGLYDDGSVRHLHVGAASELLAESGVELVAGCQWIECLLHPSGSLDCRSNTELGLPAALPSGVQSLGISEHGVLCAVLADGSVQCWGKIPEPLNWGAPADPDAVRRTISVPLPKPALQLTSGSREHHCALLEDGAVVCWPWLTSQVHATGQRTEPGAALAAVDLGTIAD